MFHKTLLSPDLDSTCFPLRSAACRNYKFTRPTRCAATQCKKKRVRFAIPLIDDIFEVPHRNCQQHLPVTTERLYLETLRLKTVLAHEQDSLKSQSRVEFELVDRFDDLLVNNELAMINFLSEKSMASLELQYQQLDEEIFHMKLEILRLKGFENILRKKLILMTNDHSNKRSMMTVLSVERFMAQNFWKRELSFTSMK
jgi:hypothetical protein